MAPSLPPAAISASAIAPTTTPPAIEPTIGATTTVVTPRSQRRYGGSLAQPISHLRVSTGQGGHQSDQRAANNLSLSSCSSSGSRRTTVAQGRPSMPVPPQTHAGTRGGGNDGPPLPPPLSVSEARRSLSSGILVSSGTTAVIPPPRPPSFVVGMPHGAAAPSAAGNIKTTNGSQGGTTGQSAVPPGVQLGSSTNSQSLDAGNAAGIGGGSHQASPITPGGVSTSNVAVSSIASSSMTVIGGPEAGAIALHRHVPLPKLPTGTGRPATSVPPSHHHSQFVSSHHQTAPVGIVHPLPVPSHHRSPHPHAAPAATAGATNVATPVHNHHVAAPGTPLRHQNHHPPHPPSQHNPGQQGTPRSRHQHAPGTTGTGPGGGANNVDPRGGGGAGAPGLVNYGQLSGSSSALSRYREMPHKRPPDPVAKPMLAPMAEHLGRCIVQPFSVTQQLVPLSWRQQLCRILQSCTSLPSPESFDPSNSNVIMTFPILALRMSPADAKAAVREDRFGLVKRAPYHRPTTSTHRTALSVEFLRLLWDQRLERLASHFTNLDESVSLRIEAPEPAVANLLQVCQQCWPKIQAAYITQFDPRRAIVMAVDSEQQPNRPRFKCIGGWARWQALLAAVESLRLRMPVHAPPYQAATNTSITIYVVDSSALSDSQLGALSTWLNAADFEAPMLRGRLPSSSATSPQAARADTTAELMTDNPQIAGGQQAATPSAGGGGSGSSNPASKGISPREHLYTFLHSKVLVNGQSRPSSFYDRVWQIHTALTECVLAVEREPSWTVDDQPAADVTFCKVLWDYIIRTTEWAELVQWIQYEANQLEQSSWSFNWLVMAPFPPANETRLPQSVCIEVILGFILSLCWGAIPYYLLPLLTYSQLKSNAVLGSQDFPFGVLKTPEGRTKSTLGFWDEFFLHQLPYQIQPVFSVCDMMGFVRLFEIFFLPRSDWSGQLIAKADWCEDKPSLIQHAIQSDTAVEFVLRVATRNNLRAAVDTLSAADARFEPLTTFIAFYSLHFLLEMEECGTSSQLSIARAHPVIPESAIASMDDHPGVGGGSTSRPSDESTGRPNFRVDLGPNQHPITATDNSSNLAASGSPGGHPVASNQQQPSPAPPPPPPLPSAPLPMPVRTPTHPQVLLGPLATRIVQLVRAAAILAYCTLDNSVLQQELHRAQQSLTLTQSPAGSGGPGSVGDGISAAVGSAGGAVGGPFGGGLGGAGGGRGTPAPTPTAGINHPIPPAQPAIVATPSPSTQGWFSAALFQRHGVVDLDHRKALDQSFEMVLGMLAELVFRAVLAKVMKDSAFPAHGSAIPGDILATLASRALVHEGLPDNRSLVAMKFEICRGAGLLMQTFCRQCLAVHRGVPYPSNRIVALFPMVKYKLEPPTTATAAASSGGPTVGGGTATDGGASGQTTGARHVEITIMQVQIPDILTARRKVYELLTHESLTKRGADPSQIPNRAFTWQILEPMARNHSLSEIAKQIDILYSSGLELGPFGGVPSLAPHPGVTTAAHAAQQGVAAAAAASAYRRLSGAPLAGPPTGAGGPFAATTSQQQQIATAASAVAASQSKLAAEAEMLKNRGLTHPDQINRYMAYQQVSTWLRNNPDLYFNNIKNFGPAAAAAAAAAAAGLLPGSSSVPGPTTAATGSQLTGGVKTEDAAKAVAGAGGGGSMAEMQMRITRWFEERRREARQLLTTLASLVGATGVVKIHDFKNMTADEARALAGPLSQLGSDSHNIPLSIQEFSAMLKVTDVSILPFAQSALEAVCGEVEGILKSHLADGLNQLREISEGVTRGHQVIASARPAVVCALWQALVRLPPFLDSVFPLALNWNHLRVRFVTWLWEHVRGRLDRAWADAAAATGSLDNDGQPPRLKWSLATLPPESDEPQTIRVADLTPQRLFALLDTPRLMDRLCTSFHRFQCSGIANARSALGALDTTQTVTSAFLDSQFVSSEPSISRVFQQVFHRVQPGIPVEDALYDTEVAAAGFLRRYSSYVLGALDHRDRTIEGELTEEESRKRRRRHADEEEEAAERYAAVGRRRGIGVGAEAGIAAGAVPPEILSGLLYGMQGLQSLKKALRPRPERKGRAVGPQAMAAGAAAIAAAERETGAIGVTAGDTDWLSRLPLSLRIRLHTELPSDSLMDRLEEGWFFAKRRHEDLSARQQTVIASAISAIGNIANNEDEFSETTGRPPNGADTAVGLGEEHPPGEPHPSEATAQGGGMPETEDHEGGGDMRDHDETGEQPKQQQGEGEEEITMGETGDGGMNEHGGNRELEGDASAAMTKQRGQAASRQHGAAVPSPRGGIDSYQPKRRRKDLETLSSFGITESSFAPTRNPELNGVFPNLPRWLEEMPVWQLWDKPINKHQPENLITAWQRHRDDWPRMKNDVGGVSVTRDVYIPQQMTDGGQMPSAGGLDRLAAAAPQFPSVAWTPLNGVASARQAQALPELGERDWELVKSVLECLYSRGIDVLYSSRANTAFQLASQHSTSAGGPAPPFGSFHCCPEWIRDTDDAAEGIFGFSVLNAATSAAQRPERANTLIGTRALRQFLEGWSAQDRIFTDVFTGATPAVLLASSQSYPTSGTSDRVPTIGDKGAEGTAEEVTTIPKYRRIVRRPPIPTRAAVVLPKAKEGSAAAAPGEAKTSGYAAYPPIVTHETSTASPTATTAAATMSAGTTSPPPPPRLPARGDPSLRTSAGFLTSTISTVVAGSGAPVGRQPLVASPFDDDAEIFLHKDHRGIRDALELMDNISL